MKRTIIKINENLCTGCGACVKGCHAGALQIVDGKAQLTDAINCDGLGACIGECPMGAITLEEHEIEPLSTQPCCNTFSSMRKFPIQLRLINPDAPFLKNTDLVLAADCTAFVCSDFHNQFMKDNSLVIACPKLDNAKDLYVAKLAAMIDYSVITSLTVIMMDVPCCGGLWHIAELAQEKAKRKIEVRKVIIT